MGRPLILLLTLTTTAALLACPDEPDGCGKDSDCKGQRICVAGACADPVPEQDAGGNDGGGSDAGAAGVDGGDAGANAGDAGVDAGADSGVQDAGLMPDAGQDGGGYDDVVLADNPVAFWAMSPAGGSEPDLTGNGNAGSYVGGTPATATMPNGDPVAVFNGSSQYLTIPSDASMSISTTGSLTWEAWIRPTVLQYPNSTAGGYVDWMGKCAEYSPSCEWEARMYNTTNPQGRCNRLSAYVFNSSAGLGSGADWQPTCGLLQAGRWYHVVGEYTTQSQPAGCPNVSSYPGSIDIWVNGIKWNQASHNPTGCMSQYSVVPTAHGSPLNIGTMSLDSYFQGAIGKVAIYGFRLSQAQITRHYQAMTGLAPAGSCGNTCTLP